MQEAGKSVDSDEPWDPKTIQPVLYDDKVRIDPDEDAASYEHYDDPEVELPVGPVVGLADDDSFATTAEDAAAGHLCRITKKGNAEAVQCLACCGESPCLL